MRHAQDFAEARNRMVERQIAARGVRDGRVLEAMRSVPREAFVREGLREYAYDDAPLPIEAGQTISQPYIVARMAELAEIGPDDRVLEVGAGSGYAAAVLSRLAREVYAIERHEELASAARERLARLGFTNVEVIQGDGTKGLARAAPFDAILVAAGAPAMPDTLRDQLKVGGRMVVPVASGPYQTLMLVRRVSETEFDEEEHGSVSFVPLIGREGYSSGEDDADEEKDESSSDASPTGFLARLLSPIRSIDTKAPARRLSERIARAAEPFADYDELARMAERFKDRRVVLLGEATHGTAEFYEARARITENLVRHHGFTIVAVEADWPDAAAYDAYVRDRPRLASEEPFSRFPRWMWRNAETEAFIRRLREINDGIQDPDRKAGFFGLDIYSLDASIDAVIAYLDQVDPETAAVARERYACLMHWRASPASYGRMALSRGFQTCEAKVGEMLRDLLRKRLDYLGRDGVSFLDAEQNARIVAGAEEYYRTMYYGAAESWNLRDSHMFATLQRLLAHGGEGAKAVVWAHNSHIGDASSTEMGWVRGEHNIGQLCREAFGPNAALVGFGTDHGTVAAASDWDAPVEIKRVRPGRRDAYEGHCHEAGIPRFLLDLGALDEETRAALSKPQLERAIGVIYRPETERMSHYFEADLPGQFDAFVWFDETRAVTPTYRREGRRGEADDTFPFGL